MPQYYDPETGKVVVPEGARPEYFDPETGTSVVAPPPEPPEDLVLGGRATGISATPWMHRSLVSLLNPAAESGMQTLESMSGPGGHALPDLLRDITPAAIGEAAPGILASAGALAAGPPGWGTLGMAALGGAGGVGYKRLSQWLGGVPITSQDDIGRALWPQGIPDSWKGDLTELLGSAGTEAVFEVFGVLGAKALRLGAKPGGVAALAEDLGLPPPPKAFHERVARKTIAGEALAVRGARKGQEKALERATGEAATLGQPPPVPEETALKYIRDTQKAFTKDLGESGKAAVEKGLSRSEGEVQALVRSIAPEVDVPSVVGRRAQGAAERGARLARKGAGGAEELYARADELNEGVDIDITGHVESLRELVEETMLSPTADPTALVQYTRKLAEVAPDLVPGAQGQAQALLANVSAANREAMEKALAETLGEAGGEITIPYAQARELQKWLGQRMIGKKLPGDIAEGRVKQMWGTLKESMNRSTEGTEGGVALAEANRFYASLKDVVDKSSVSRLVDGFEKNPEKVLLLMSGSGAPSNVRYLRKAIIGYAEKHGALKEQAAAHEAWDQMGRLFADEKLLDGGISAFPDRIRPAVVDETLEALYGREMANNFRTIASSVRALKQAGPATATAPHRGALKRLEELEGALRYMGRVSEGGGIGAYRFGAGASLPARLIAGAPAALVTGGTIELAGGLITWAATNRARTRLFRNAASDLFRVGAPGTARLINSYLDYQRDMALVRERREKGGPPEPGATVEMTPEKLTPPKLGPPPEPEPPISFGFLPKRVGPPPRGP